MRAAFVLVIGMEPGSIPGHVAAMLGTACPPPGLPFVARSHLEWSDSTGSVVVGAWSEARRGPWQVDSRGVSLVVGEVRRRGHPWLPDVRWPELLRELLDGAPEDTIDDLAGVFSGAALGRDGTGHAITDPCGQRSLYHGRCTTHDVIGSNPALVAHSLVGVDQRPLLDPVAVCGQAYTKHRVGERTGFEGVRSLPIGTYANVRPRSAVAIRPRRAPWSPPPELADLGVDDLVDAAYEAIADELRAALTFPTKILLADLTGGKDSRLVLGAALLSGVADRLVFRTDGPEVVHDVVIARELADLVGVRWLGRDDLATFVRDRGGASAAVPTDPLAGSLSWSDRMRHYVAVTAGICNLWDAKELRGTPAARISGLTGEVLRSSLSFELPDEPALVRRFDRHFGALELLRPDALRRYRDEWIDDLLGGSGDGLTTNDRHDAFLLRTQVRSNFGPREEATPIRRLLPLSALGAVHAAFALGGRGRVTERIHRDVVTRASPELARHRFAKGSWQVLEAPPSWTAPHRGSAWRMRVGRKPVRRDRPREKAPLTATAPTNLVQVKHGADTFDERVAFLHDVLADAANPAWDLIDRDAACAAAARFGSLSRPAQVELMGAATAALWLARGPG